MWRVYLRQHQTIGPWMSRLETRPNWVIKAAVLATVLMIVIPIVLLCAAALLVGLAVFLALAVVSTLMVAVKRFLYHMIGRPDTTPGRHDLESPYHHDDGRRNVRVRVVGR